MPLPEAIRAMIDVAINKGGWRPDSVREEARRYAAAWRLYLDLYEMDETKLAALIEEHDGESKEKLALRRKLSAIFNFVPSIVRMTVNYLHSQQPTFEVADPQLKSFLENCDGSGRSLATYIRREALPMALVFGFIDTLIQNPATEEGVFVTAQDQTEQSAKLMPRVLTITPIKRIDWSSDRTHRYQWFRFIDSENEGINPFASAVVPNRAFITMAAFTTVTNESGEDVSIIDGGKPAGYWVRSWLPPEKSEYEHDGDFLPTFDLPVATMYYQQSVDPDRLHFGISKIAMIAILTKKIIQLLSWTDEDILANLAIFVFPGDHPKDQKGEPLKIKLTPFDIIWLGNDAKVDPRILQGDTTHIDVKWKSIDAYIREILRLAFLIGASGETETVTSGVQGVVIRTELFKELQDLAGRLDEYAREIIYYAACSLKGEQIPRDVFDKSIAPKVDYYKGPYTAEPLADMIKNTNDLLDIFGDISPTMAEGLYRDLATNATYNEDESRSKIFAEIKANFGAKLAERKALGDSMAAAGTAAATAAAASGDSTQLTNEETPTN